jgi:hypothetical protein
MIITTIIPTYRRPRLVVRAIESVLAQTFPDLLVCVYDNASGDETEDVVRAIAARDGRVRYHRHERNIGAAANYNFGLLRVEAPLFSMLGDDDYLLPHFYEDAVAALERETRCGFYCARTLVRNETLGVTLKRSTSWSAGVYEPTAANVAHMARDHFINTSVVFRRDVIRTSGTLDRFGSDRNYVIVAAALHPFVVSEREGGVLTIHEQSFSGGAQGIAFSDADVFSHDVDYVLGSNRDLLGRLESIAIEGKEEIAEAVRAQARYDTFYTYCMRALPSGAAADAGKLLEAADELRLGLSMRLVLRVFRVLARSRFASRIAARAVGFLYPIALWFSGTIRDGSSPCPPSNTPSTL